MRTATAMPGTAAATTDAGGRPPGRRRRAVAVLIDGLSAMLAMAVAALVATLWLLARTGWGREDAASGDAVLAAALVLAALPAWSTWQIARVRRGAGTAGQARAGVAVAAHPVGERARFALLLRRLAFHPLTALAWLWAALLVLLFDATLVAAACAAAAAVWLLAGIVSAALVLRDPGARALHDRLAGTRLVRR